MHQKIYAAVSTRKMANPGLLLCIFGLFKHKFYRNTVGVSKIRTRIIRVESEHTDPLNTTTGPRINYLNKKNKWYSKFFCHKDILGIKWDKKYF